MNVAPLSVYELCRRIRVMRREVDGIRSAETHMHAMHYFRLAE